MSGTGEKTSESCGLIKHRAVCSRDPNHLSYPVSFRCGNPLCPVCYKAWQLRAADRIGSRVWGYKEASGHGTANPSHVVWSLPPDLYRSSLPLTEDIERIRTIAQRHARKMGSKGGCQIIHTHRIKDEYKAIVEAARPVLGGYLHRYEALKTFPNWRDMVYYSPHVHDLQYGFLRPSKLEKDGWVYKKFGQMPDRKDVERRAFYLLSHAPIVPGHTAMTYYGCCGYHRLRVRYHYTPLEPCLCPVCGAPLVVEWEGVVTNEEVMRRKTRHTYFVAPPPGKGNDNVSSLREAV